MIVRSPRRQSLAEKLVRENALPVVAIAAAAVALTIGWELFGGRTAGRTADAIARSGDVARIWGGPLLQPQPEVRWRRADAATVELASGEVARTSVDVELDTQYRRRGIVQYPGYEAAFSGTYDFVNPSTDAAFVAFSVGLPVSRESLMLRDLKLLVDGKEDPAHTEYAADRIVWTGRVEKGTTARFLLAYRARGLERFGYRLAAASPDRADPGGWSSAAGAIRPVTGFRLQLTVRGAAGELDFPVGSMSPTTVEVTQGGRRLVWDVDRLLTSFDVGVVLPDGGNVAAALSRLVSNAPFFYLLFAFGLLVALSAARPRARALHLLGLSCGYFLYFPLATYLTAYVPWPVAAGTALAGVGGLSIFHALRFVGRRAALLVAASEAFFLAVPASAYLVPAHTGLILVVAGFLALAIGLQLLGSAVRRLPDEDGEPGAPPVVPPAGPGAGVVPAILVAERS